MPTEEEIAAEVARKAAKVAEVTAARAAAAAKVEEQQAAVASAKAASAVSREAQRKAIGDVHGHAKAAMVRLRASHREREERDAREGEEE